MKQLKFNGSQEVTIALALKQNAKNSPSLVPTLLFLGSMPRGFLIAFCDLLWFQYNKEAELW